MKSVRLLCSAALAALVWSVPVAAQQKGEDGEAHQGTVEPILVSASRDPSVMLGDYTGSVTILTARQLEDRQVRDIGDVLRDVPGVAVSSVAGQTPIRLRGSEANHVLVLVDGIEVSDPFAGEFDIGTLQAEIGARVEVVRGPQSALYGNDAIGGVVAYESASGRDRPGFAARLEGGLDNTINGAARAGFAGQTWDAALSATVVSTDGQPNARNGTRDIGRDSYTVSGKGSVEIADGFALRAASRFIRTQGQFNDQDFDPASPTFGFVIDSPGTRFVNEALYALIGARLNALDGRWTHDLSAQIADIDRDTFGAFGPSNSSKGDRLKASYISTFELVADHFLILGADWERERFRNATPGGFAFTGRRQIENAGIVGEYRYNGERMDLSAAIRQDFNDRFADETTFRAGAGYRVTDSTRLRAAAGSGIKNPGFFELFGFVDGRFLGNADLTPEKSTSWEIGADQSFADNAATLSVTYFNATLDREIFTTFPAPTFIATPANRTTKSDQQGVEVALAAQIGPQFSLNAAYTYIDAEENGVTEVRRPKNIASAALTWTAPADAASATLVIRHNGQTRDLAFTDPSFVPVRVILDDFTLVNFNAVVKLSDGIEAFARVDNLLNETYEQVFSFVSAGRSMTAGVTATF